MTDYNESQKHPEQPARSGVSPGLLFLMIPALLGLLVAGVMLLNGERADNQAATPGPAQEVISGGAVRPLRDWQADDFTLPALDGGEITLSDYRGRTIFLNLWATWCEPCKREFPAFEQFVNQQGADGAVLLAANIDEPADVVRDFLDNEVDVQNVPVVMAGLDLLDDYPARNFPTTYVIDPTGAVRFFKVGEVTLEDLDAYLDAIQTTE